MTHRVLLACACFAGLSLVLSCGDSSTNSCQSKDFQLPETDLTRVADVQLLNGGGGFVLAGLDGNTVRWGHIAAADGKIADESSFDLPPRQIGPLFALTGKGGAANQLVAIYIAPQASNPALFEVSAIAQTAGAAATAPRVIFTTIAGTDPATIRLAAGSSSSGMRAALAIGFAGMAGTKVTTYFLGPDAAPVGAPLSLDAPDDWDCPRFGLGRPGIAPFALAWRRFLPSDTTSPWIDIHEISDDGFVMTTHKAEAVTAFDRDNCPLVSPSDHGYLFAWQNRQGSSIADYTIKEPATVTSSFVDSAVSYGGPAKQPPVVALAGMSYNAALLMGAASGPKILLFDPFGVAQGRTLSLPTKQGQVGPVHAAPTVNSLQVTYREGTKLASGSGPRHFVVVDCPLPK